MTERFQNRANLVARHFDLIRPNGEISKEIITISEPNQQLLSEIAEQMQYLSSQDEANGCFFYVFKDINENKPLYTPMCISEKVSTKKVRSGLYHHSLYWGDNMQLSQFREVIEDRTPFHAVAITIDYLPDGESGIYLVRASVPYDDEDGFKVTLEANSDGSYVYSTDTNAKAMLITPNIEDLILLKDRISNTDPNDLERIRPLIKSKRI